MARLIYSAIASLDEYVEDERGTFDWAAPDAQVLAAVNELERPIGIYLYGRRMYETMVCWETASTSADQSHGVRGFGELWRVAEKVVYSRTVQTVTSARTRIEREFDPPRCGASRRQRQPTSLLVVRSSLARRSPPASSTSAICSSTRSSSVAVSAHCRTGCTLGFSSWMRADSGTASSTSTTASSSEQHGKKMSARSWSRPRLVLGNRSALRGSGFGP